jgi:predicted nucleic acid-binding protein
MAGWTLEQVEPGTRVFVDSSILLYHSFRKSDQCRRFLGRCETHECSAITSVVVLLEVTHRLMAAEAVAAGLVPRRQAVRSLQERPDVVRKLRVYGAQATEIATFGIEILPADLGVCLRAAEFRERFGLLTNDSIVVATMRDAGVTAIATADRDFERVEGISVFRPTDLGAAAQALA